MDRDFPLRSVSGHEWKSAWTSSTEGRFQIKASANNLIDSTCAGLHRKEACEREEQHKRDSYCILWPFWKRSTKHSIPSTFDHYIMTFLDFGSFPCPPNKYRMLDYGDHLIDVIWVSCVFGKRISSDINALHLECSGGFGCTHESLIIPRH